MSNDVKFFEKLLLLNLLLTYHFVVLFYCVDYNVDLQNDKIILLMFF